MKLVRVYLIFLVFMFFTQCKKAPSEGAILSKKQMSSLLFQLHLQQEITIKDTIDFKAVENEILRKNNISRSKLEKSHSYYMQHPKDYAEIIQSVIDALDVRLKKLNLQKENQSI